MTIQPAAMQAPLEPISRVKEEQTGQRNDKHKQNYDSNKYKKTMRLIPILECPIIKGNIINYMTCDIVNASGSKQNE